jgi:hypothetical protein
VNERVKAHGYHPDYRADIPQLEENACGDV